jgi:PAS domain S-box-containing protein
MTNGSRTEHLRISDVIRSIHQGLVDASDRASLETDVCEAFATSSPYVFAWIGTHDTETDRIVPRASAGVATDYLDSISIAVDDESERRGPSAKALRTGRIHVQQDIRNDPAFEPWREQALERGFESSAAIPLANDTNAYGVLQLYADRPKAFGEREQELLAELGEAVATAIAGIEARRELEAQKEQYERLTTRISDAYLAVDASWEISYWNEEIAEHTDTPASDVLGETLWDVFHTIENTDVERRFRTAMAAKEPQSFESYLEEPFDRWLAFEVYPDEEGLSIFSRDVTERKEHEQERAETNTVLRTIVANLPSGLLVEDADRNVLTVNEELCDVLDVPGDYEELLGEDFETAAQQIKDRFADPEEFVSGITERIAEREPVVNETLRLADGRVLERDYVPYDLPDGNANLWLYRDVTERKNRERELERARRLIENSTDIATVIEPDGTITYVSPAVERVLGYEPDELIGENGFGYQPAETSDAVAAGIERVVENPDEIQTVQTQFRRTDGSWCWIESSLRNHLDDDIIEGVLVNSRDITERKAYEQRIETQRDDLQTLNQVVRHDIRNDLQLVSAYAELVGERVDDDTTDEHVDTIIDRTAHAIELTTIAAEMAEVMVRGEQENEPIPLQGVLAAEVADVADAYPSAVVEIEGEIPQVMVRANRMLDSVFGNLLKNAVQHNDDAVPEVTVGVTDNDETVRVRVADNGPGVPDAKKAEIFGKGAKGLDSEGTGVGLHLVQTLVDGYGGDVRVEDNDPGGAVFVVDLPKAR